MAGAGTGTRIRLDRISIRYGDFTAVDDLTLAIEPGEILALLGASGCGKTTTLKAVAGLQRIDDGEIRFGERRVDGLAPHRRNVGMVFQSYALFPHMTVTENVRFGLAMHGVPRHRHGERIRRVLDMLHIAALADSYPDQISGGQQQRVALARTLVVEPLVLLLDEPLSALDRQLRDVMRTEIRNVVKQTGITSLLVTHDQEEALTVADRVAVMRAGRIEQVGSAREIYEAPRTRYVADFIGRMNYLPGRVLDQGGGVCRVETAAGVIVAPAVPGLGAGQPVEAGFRPEVVRVDDAGAPRGDRNRVEARLVGETFAGVTTEYRFRTAGEVEIRALGQSDARFGAGADRRSCLEWPVSRTLVFAAGA
jgi:ABC-type Fe3+/spermidine/putrescine transport system ATPase subunit